MTIVVHCAIFTNLEGKINALRKTEFINRLLLHCQKRPTEE